MILLKNDKFANKKGKGVKSQKKIYFRCFEVSTGHKKWKGVKSQKKKKYFRWFEVSTCPLGQVRTCPNHDFSGPDMTFSGPDMSKSQLFRSGHVQIRTFQVRT